MTPDTKEEPHDVEMILANAKVAVDGVCKNSKLREHYIRLAIMNNIMRAFVVHYELDSYKAIQEQLLLILRRVEERKNRIWLTSEKIQLHTFFTAYCELLRSATEEQLCEILRFVEQNSNAGKWIVYRKKNGKHEAVAA